MVIERGQLCWKVMFADRRPEASLEAAALACGYRLEGLSLGFGFSETYVRRIFTRDVGLTPKLWLRWERMVIARRMLRGGMWPDEVRDALGFSPGSGFRKEFRATYGVSPGVFRGRM